jgi:hypothetical protein
MHGSQTENSQIITFIGILKYELARRKSRVAKEGRQELCSLFAVQYH